MKKKKTVTNTRVYIDEICRLVVVFRSFISKVTRGASHGVGVKMAATHAASQTPNAALQAANAGVAAITAPGTVPNVNPAAAKHATVTAAHPA